MLFKSLFIIFAIGICAVSCHTDGDDGLTSKVVDMEHPSRYYSPIEPENHGGHVDKHHEHLYNADHHEDYDHDHYDDEPHYGDAGFQANDPLNQYKPDIHYPTPMEHGRVEAPQMNHFEQGGSPPTYEQATRLPTIDENRVLDNNNIPLNAPHQPMRERIGERVNRLASSSGRRTSNALNAARPKLETLRVDLKDRAISLQSNPKVMRGIEVVSRKKASLKGKLLSLKSQHDMRKAERLQHQQQLGQHQVNLDPAMNGAYSPNGVSLDQYGDQHFNTPPTAARHEDVSYNNDQIHRH